MKEPKYDKNTRDQRHEIEQDKKIKELTLLVGIQAATMENVISRMSTLEDARQVQISINSNNEVTLKELVARSVHPSKKSLLDMILGR